MQAHLCRPWARMRKLSGSCTHASMLQASTTAPCRYKVLSSHPTRTYITLTRQPRCCSCMLHFKRRQVPYQEAANCRDGMYVWVNKTKVKKIHMQSNVYGWERLSVGCQSDVCSLEENTRLWYTSISVQFYVMCFLSIMSCVCSILRDVCGQYHVMCLPSIT